MVGDAEMVRRLFIIEAPGKYRQFFRAASEAFPNDDVTVWATRGMIADLPTTETGIDLETYKVAKELVNTNGRGMLERILEHTDEAGNLTFDEITVCTDPDMEGEHIAKQIFRLLDPYLDNSVIRRGAIDCITAQSLINMETSPAPDESVLAAREFRRVTDRLIPLVLADNGEIDEWTGMGRVQMQMLNLLDGLQNTWDKYTVNGHFRYKGSAFYFDGTLKTEEERDAFLDLLRQAKKGEAVFERSEEKAVVPPPNPVTYASLFKRCGHEYPLDIKEEIQHAYMNGLISYPRSMTPLYSPLAKKQIQDISRELHLGALIQKDAMDAPSLSVAELYAESSGHMGVHPTGTEALPFILKNPANPEIPIAKYVVSDACASQMRHAVVLKKRLRIQDKNTGFAITGERWSVKERGFLAVYAQTQTLSPFPQIFPDAEPPLFVAERHPSKNEIIGLCHEKGIGQPSQAVYTLTNLCTKGLVSNYMLLTEKGRNILSYIRNKAPFLLDTEFSESMNQTIREIRKHPSDYTALALAFARKFSLLPPVKADFDGIVAKHNFNDNKRHPIAENISEEPVDQDVSKMSLN